MESETILSRATTEFALALLKKISEDDNIGNIFFSPFSIFAALAMVNLGTAGNTATQISQVLGFSVPEPPQSEGDGQQLEQMQQTQQRTDLPQANSEEIKANFRQLLTELNQEHESYDLSIANRLFGENSYEFNPNFLAEIAEYYMANLEKVDFRNSAEGARIHINQWVEEQTKEKIRNLLPPDSVDSLTKMVLVNAIYFKGLWEKQFEEGSTRDAEFRLNRNERKTVKMMSQSGLFRIRTEPDYKILEMPYKGNDLSMLIILPNDIEDDTTGLEKLEGELTTDKYDEWEESMEQKELDVSLPRFKMELSYDLRQVLSSMGMVDAFDASRSDFSGMSEADDLSISQIVHKAFVEVNEKGTEAAAATGVIVGVTSVQPPRETFYADHPFLIAVKHKRTRTILFAGRYSSP